ncbi:MAG TPA: hypothetical protein VF777_03350 [Phycisphaerales bacterium]
MFGRSLAGLVVLVVVLVVGVGNRFWHRSQVNEDYRKEFHSLIEKCDGYGGNREYFDWLVDSTHDEVFNEAYKMKAGSGRGGLARDESTFDEDQYVEAMFEGMIAKAKNDKADQVVKSIEGLIAKLEKEAEAEMKAAAPPGGPQRK